MIITAPLTTFQVNNFNHSTSFTIYSYTSADYRSVENSVALVATIGIFLFAVFSPVVLIALYPTQKFKNLISKCCCQRFICALNFFTEKFHSCYRDGLDGGKDMRSFASLPFFTAILLYVVWSISASFIFVASIYASCSLLIAIVQPHKKRYMVVTESLIFANGALVAAISVHRSSFYITVSQICATLPAFGFTLFILHKLLKKSFLKLCPEKTSTVRLWLKRGSNDNQEENGQQEMRRRSNYLIELNIQNVMKKKPTTQHTNLRKDFKLL